MYCPEEMTQTFQRTVCEYRFPSLAQSLRVGHLKYYNWQVQHSRLKRRKFASILLMKIP